ncbi:uncharacterized protein A4U43_C03F7680 [Asparagus officinalis]|uniref:BHLH domain-containing protein n=1 Tax=Asparagus officinalis TaxID=4686 RepID=A0A5P1FCI0_ASPOF|nr:transcription factor bHLH74-like isoform X2 [Asparagus officinalis]ONK74559.1 uncharacterized protein A4U43_C03F7680 [Asparagus officinalis]
MRIGCFKCIYRDVTMSVQKEISSMEVPCSSGVAAEQFMATDWDPLHSVSGSTGFSSYNVGNSNIERLPSLSFFGSDSLSDLMNSFGLPENTQMASVVCPQEFPSGTEHGAEKNPKGKKRKKFVECGAVQNAKTEQEKETQAEPLKSQLEKDEKKPKNEVSPGVKETGNGAKEEYIHIRAKRGQATNSHSLAERVRREKISERMRLLQDIVPGCNKITGKAVMLDEIINYVQSLQRQVEFLSMKLAAVNPELSFDIEQIFTKENPHSRHGSSPSLNYSQLQPGITIPSLPNSRVLLRTSSSPQISPIAQIPNSWDNEFQNAIQMGFIPNLAHDGTELNPNGSMKVEL